ncbi:unnamed protein product [Protopolystoma xenopodis]|uniref:Uncharacterized protein n=1 Tax=Protopolystoma xenopodis TaxID=117903 RepID=A0A3S5A2Y5_9PLAT|nr:unnamed protein product [Protopolystoma xenopodis]
MTAILVLIFVAAVALLLYLRHRQLSEDLHPAKERSVVGPTRNDLRWPPSGAGGDLGAAGDARFGYPTDRRLDARDASYLKQPGLVYPGAGANLPTGYQMHSATGQPEPGSAVYSTYQHNSMGHHAQHPQHPHFMQHVQHNKTRGLGSRGQQHHALGRQIQLQADCMRSGQMRAQLKPGHTQHHGHRSAFLGQRLLPSGHGGALPPIPNSQTSAMTTAMQANRAGGVGVMLDWITSGIRSRVYDRGMTTGNSTTVISKPIIEPDRLSTNSMDSEEVVRPCFRNSVVLAERLRGLHLVRSP